jgi:hypothetical protein
MFGRETLDTTRDLTFHDPHGYDPEFGLSISPAGDVNGDNVPDFMITDGDFNEVYIYLGGIDLDTLCDLTIEAPVETGSFGGTLADAGDVNGDGYDDILIGDLTFLEGKTFLYFGGDPMDSIVDWVVDRNELSYQHFVGSHVDVNCDGYHDIIISSPNGGPGTDTSFVEIFYGGKTIDSIPDIIISFLTIGSPFPAFLSGIDDVNVDGYDDILVSGHPHIIYFGGEHMDTLPDLIMDHSADQVSRGGDINGDGYPDALASLRDTFLGNLRVYLGSPNMDNVEDVFISGLSVPGYSFGESMSTAGDMNGDGLSDIAISAWDGGKLNKGFLYIYSGDSSLTVGIDREGEKPPQIPTTFSLSQNYPNPFNPSTTIEYSVPNDMGDFLKVVLQIFDIRGRLIKTLISDIKRPGRHIVQWDSSDDMNENVPSGAYFYRLRIEEETTMKKMLLLR